MRDELHQNLGVMTGTPTLIAGQLSDGDQALRFNGSTNSMSVADSPSDSLAVADGGAGGMALYVIFRVAAIPGSTKTIIDKSGSYKLEINSSGKLLFTLTNGANNVTVTSAATIAINTWYHVVCVYNGDYTGTTQFGNTTPGSALLSIPSDYALGVNQPTNLNLQVCKFTALERGQITAVSLDLHRVHDATTPQVLKAVVFGPGGATTPGKFLGSSPEQVYLNPDPARAFIPFPTSAPFDAGDVWLGFHSGGTYGTSGMLEIGHETSGGTRAWKPDPYSDGPADPFGTPGGSDAKKFAAYADYTATNRTGAEGKALIYLNGVLDASSSYAHGIADSANAISVAPAVAVDLDDWAIFNRKLTPVEVAFLYSVR